MHIATYPILPCKHAPSKQPQDLSACIFCFLHPHTTNNTITSLILLRHKPAKYDMHFAYLNHNHLKKIDVAPTSDKLETPDATNYS